MKNKIGLELQPVLLPTSDATSLTIQDGIGLYVADIVEAGNSAWKNQHLYLTSDRKVAEGEYFIHQFYGDVGGLKQEVKKFKKTEDYSGIGKLKIEFTTDQNLIDDGVLAIPEKVTIPKYTRGFDHTRIGTHKVEFLEEFCRRWNENVNPKIGFKERFANSKIFKLRNDEIGKIPAYETGLTAEETKQKNLAKKYADSAVNKISTQAPDKKVLIHGVAYFAYLQALEDTADNKFSLEDIEKCLGFFTDDAPASYIKREIIKHFTKEQEWPKDKMQMWCETESIGEDWENYPPNTFNKIKLVDGQAVIHFNT